MPSRCNGKQIFLVVLVITINYHSPTVTTVAEKNYRAGGARMKIALFGIGGVGGIVGGALARSHAETYFYVRGENLNAIRRNGLTVQSVLWGDFVAHPKRASDKAAELGIMDAIFVSCKGNSLKAACEAITPMAGPETVVIPLLNGVIVSDIMEPLLPPCILADGTIRVFSRLEKPGHIVQSAGLCSIVFGMKDGSKPAKLEELAAILNNAGVKTTVSGNILVESWAKYAIMCGNSTVLCYYDAPVGKVRENPDHETVLRAVSGELTAVAAAKGVTLPGETTDRFVDDFSKMPPDTMTSLYRDLSGGKPANETELDHIIGRMVTFGQQTGVPTPYHKAAYERFVKRG
ncbi:2-dehydropantoate 2-reductase [uncultured delta proteobacterium]|uniref:2-dehydropantoate 2-reductase n=1 Tax=uncultured delta proteobacterium TaxID=34034 RepID=A0A212IY43_9DELT|nr:2-dehydropantoate 2-reductase [uncultured delta proteobacterium]